MPRVILLYFACAVIAASCGDDETSGSTILPPEPPPATTVAPPPATTASPGTTIPPGTTTTVLSVTTAAPATSAPSSTTTTPPAPPSTTAAPAPTTTTTPPVQTDASLTDRLWAVVLVDGDDVLNVRTGPGVAFDKLTSFGATHNGIVLTGIKAEVGGSVWVEVETEDARGWVNKYFLTEEWTLREVGDQWNMQAPLVEFAAAVEAGGDLGTRVSARGLFVVYYDTLLRRWKQSDLDDVMNDGVVHSWSSPGCDPGCVEDTFADAVGLQFYGVYEDIGDDAVGGLDDIILGGNGPFPPEAAIPAQFENFHWVVIHDPGDDPEFDGLDWQTWFVYYNYEDDDAVIVGLSPAAWAP